jgi:competence protein ComEC
MVVIIWLLTLTGLLQPPEVTVTFFDVGQGDSAFVKWRDGTQMLIDGGPSTDVLSELGRIMLPWDRKIDYVVLTHPHADHTRGLVTILERFQVATVVTTDKKYYEGWHKEFQRLITENEINHLMPWEFGFDEVKVLYPLSESDYVKHSNINEASIVMLINGSYPILFMGDAGIVVEQKLLNDGSVKDVSVLKIGHHGSRTSTSRTWLRSLTPEVAIVSAGEKNRHGHPHVEVLNRLKEFAVNVFRTDQRGTMQIRSFSDRLDIRTEK